MEKAKVGFFDEKKDNVMQKYVNGVSVRYSLFAFRISWFASCWARHKGGVNRTANRDKKKAPVSHL